MGVTYAVIEEEYAHLDGFRVGSGIAVCAAEVSGEAPTCLYSIHDITSDRERIEMLVDDCNRLGLADLHLYDVVEDLLAE